MSNHIANLVGRCYSLAQQNIGLIPNELDGQNPPSFIPISGPVNVPTQTPSEVIAGLVGRCYGPNGITYGPSGTGPTTLSNKPNVLDGGNPKPKPLPGDGPDTVPDPYQVIQGLIGRCYPDLPPLVPPPPFDDPDDIPLIVYLPKIPFWDDFFPPPGDGQPRPPGDDGPYDPPDLQYFIHLPNPEVPTFIVDPRDDCERVVRLRIKDQLECLGGGYWLVIATGEKLFCEERTPDFDWEKCVRNALKCTFQPYIGGLWRPPATDCNSYWPNGWSADNDKVCIDNCYPERLAIYESNRGGTSGEYDYNASLMTSSGYSVTSQTPAFWVLTEKYDDNSTLLFKYNGTGNDNFLTTNPGAPDGPGAGERSSMNAAGMQFVGTLGYVFPSSDKAIGVLGDNEKIWALHRFYNSSTFDHKYTIDPEIPGAPPELCEGKFAYRIPLDPRWAMQFTLDVEKGNAGYNNTLGMYIADSTGPKKGFIIVPSAKSGVNINRITVSASEYQAYPGGTIGFFIIPNGAGYRSFTQGESLTFTPLGNGSSAGFRGVGITSAEGNYCLFSDKQWNKFKIDQTKWVGNQQYWEDLINGDNDYDDLRFWHKMEYTNNGYNYEGIQCYVYANDRPTPTYAPKFNPNPCETRMFVNNFVDVVASRTGCGAMSPPVQTSDPTAVSTGKCNGLYATQLNSTQTVTTILGGKIRIKSYGGITGGVTGSTIRFTFEIKKNGVQIFQDQFEAKYWPRIGKDLFDAEITLSAGDTLTFSLLSIDAGPAVGSVSPAIAIYNVTKGVFETTWTLNINTVDKNDAVLGANVYSAPAINPNIGNYGQITGLGFSFSPSNVDEGIYFPGCKSTDSWYKLGKEGEGSYSIVYSNSALQPMSSIAATDGRLFGGGNRLGGVELPSISAGYIDTGIPPQSGDEYDYGHTQETIRRIGGIYNSLVENHLVTRWEIAGTEFSSTDRALLSAITPTAFAKKKLPWYNISSPMEIGARVWNGSKQTPVRDTYYSSHTFIHDYILDPQALTGGGGVTSGKIRVGFTFYAPTNDVQLNRNWYCIINLIKVVNVGRGYSPGQSFTFYWPPVRGNQQKKNEDKTNTPFYPDHESGFDMPKELSTYYEDRTKIKRIGKEALYQESHNKNSPIWYMSSTKNNFRIQFKVNIHSTQPA